MIFVDSSAWFAVVNRSDRYHERAKSVLAARSDLMTSELVVAETWLLTNSRIDFQTAENFLRLIGKAECKICWSNEHAIGRRRMRCRRSIKIRPSPS